jgi:hypothetical protein
MSLKQVVSVAVVVIPIFGLLTAGGIIALKSGVSHVNSSQDLVKVAGNFSQLLLRVTFYVVGLILLQYCIGMRPSLGW